MNSITSKKLGAAAAIVALAVSACGSSDDGGGGGGGGDKVEITSPKDGADVHVPFKLEWNSTVPLGPTDSGKDHVHVYVDGKENDYTVVGGTSFMMKKLSPGKHEVEISLQHADHSPVGPESKIDVNVVSGSDDSDDSGDTGDSGGGGY